MSAFRGKADVMRSCGDTGDQALFVKRDPHFATRAKYSEQKMTTATLASQPSEEHIDFADMRRRIRAIFIGSIGNLVEWYDFYAYAAFALYFAGAFFPNSNP